MSILLGPETLKSYPAKQFAKTKKRIGFFAPAESEYAQRLVEGIVRYQTDRGGCIVRDFRFAAEEPEDQEAWAKRPRPWESWKPDGLVVNIAPDPGLAEWVGSGNIKVVNTSSICTAFPTVHPSITDVVSAAYEHFSSPRFENFAFVMASGFPSPHATALKAFLAQRGLSLRTAALNENPSRWDGHIEQRLAESAELVEMLREAPKPLAVVAANDQIGRVVCIAAENLGLSIPWQVAVLGINNVSAARTFFPPLSSIHTPGEEVGYRAVELLMHAIAGKPIPARTEVPVGTVISRQSTTMGPAIEADVVLARQVIRDRACDGVSIEHILNDLNVSRSTLEREFASVLGCTPGEEMARVRVERSKELLRTTSLPIRRIAHMVGYESAANFTTFFRKKTGMTPRSFRKL